MLRVSASRLQCDYRRDAMLRVSASRLQCDYRRDPMLRSKRLYRREASRLYTTIYQIAKLEEALETRSIASLPHHDSS
jgi:hypothetical protein